jgi:hypothetical protein
VTLARSSGLRTQLRERKCTVCKDKFKQVRPMQAVCGPACAGAHARRISAKQAARQARTDRVQTRANLEKLKTRGDHIAETQAAFNALVRFRDRNETCISCQVVLSTLSDQIGGGYDCGHYRSRGSAPHLRFDFRNAHGQCKKCNRYRSGNAADYRIGLIARIGQAAVTFLECDQAGGAWTIPELLAMKADFRARLRALKADKPDTIYSTGSGYPDAPEPELISTYDEEAA